MQEDNDDKEQEAAKYVAGFIIRFKFKFGVVPKVEYDLRIPKIIPLSVIVEAANAVLNVATGLNYENGISTVYHDDSVLLYRWIYYKIAVDSKHSPMRAARFIKQNAANTQHGRSKINRLLNDGDQKTTNAYNKVRAEINDKILRGI